MVEYINNAVQSAMGYSVFGYFLLFEEEDAAKLLDEHVRARLIVFFSSSGRIVTPKNSPSQPNLSSSQRMQIWARNTWELKEAFENG